ncbi:MAG: hypothetical protein R2788_21750 [Saprospiraceae bacterium]
MDGQLRWHGKCSSYRCERTGTTDPETITRTWTYTDNQATRPAFLKQSRSSVRLRRMRAMTRHLCEGEIASLSGNVSGGFNSPEWTTSGDGIFQNPTSPNTDYTLRKSMTC